jgi:hypothetical protein
MRLFLSPSLRYFEPMRLLPGVPVDHMCFEYDLVEAIRPKMLVDLGAGNAFSFFVFCQAMRDHDIDGICFAVDSWADDSKKAEEDETHSSSITHHARLYYRGFSYIMRMSAREALVHFDDESLQLLRIDAARLDAPLEELLSLWLPKLAPGGVLLCPAVTSLPGARECWERACAGNAAVTFERAGGLGVLHRQPVAAPLADLLTLIDSTDASDHIDLQSYYAHAAHHHWLRIAVRAQRFFFGKKKPSQDGAG